MRAKNMTKYLFEIEINIFTLWERIYSKWRWERMRMRKYVLKIIPSITGSGTTPLTNSRKPYPWSHQCLSAPCYTYRKHLSYVLLKTNAICKDKNIYWTEDKHKYPPVRAAFFFFIIFLQYSHGEAMTMPT